MTKAHAYDDGCAAAHALDMVGDRWALLIVRELILGPKRFTDLRGGLPGISANMLAQRLKALGTAGIVRHLRLPPPNASMAYALTEWGRELEPILLQLLRWGVRSPSFQRGRPLNVDSMVLSMRGLFDAARATDGEVRLALTLDGQPFEARVAAGRFDVHRGRPGDGAPAGLATSPTTLLHLAYGGASLQAALDAGQARISGDRGAVERFLGCFSIPAPALADPAADPA